MFQHRASAAREGWRRRAARHGRRLALAAAACVPALTPPELCAQDLAPRALTIAPLGSNAVILANTFNDGNLLFEGSIPINDATASLNVPALTYYRALNLFGRSANATATLPYGVGTFEGAVRGESQSIYRSGLLDSVFRLSVNLMGGPAMSLAEMRGWQQKTLVGLNLKLVAPTGQYDPTKLINLGANRWAVQPELGVSHRFGHFIVDAYAAVWLYGRNDDFFSRNAFVEGTHSLTQDPVYAIQAHLSYDVRPRFWVSLDANFWRGGRISIDGVESADSLQQSSRVGVTGSFPLSRRVSLKLSYADGAYVRLGGDFLILSAALQYAWIDKPK